MEVISIIEIREITRRILDKLEFEFINQDFKSKTNLYREIPTDKWDDFSNEANYTSSNDLVLGDLEDDLKELKKLANDPERPCTFVDLDRFASLLREISETLNPSN